MLKEEYRDAFAFLRENKRFFLLVSAGFLLGWLLSGIGFWFIFRGNPELLSEIMRSVSEVLDNKQITDEVGNISAVRLFFANFQAVSISILGGLLPFFYLPAWTLVLNAVLLGIVSAATLQLEIPFLVLVASLLPHGIFELPALFLGGGMGLRLCHSLARRIFRRPEPSFVELASRMLRVTVLIVLPLLVVAAFVEAHLTGPIASLFL